MSGPATASGPASGPVSGPGPASAPGPASGLGTTARPAAGPAAPKAPGRNRAPTGGARPQPGGGTAAAPPQGAPPPPRDPPEPDAAPGKASGAPPARPLRTPHGPRRNPCRPGAVRTTTAQATVVRTTTVRATVVRARDAPGPTLVVRLDQLPAGALALGGELARLRRALAGTPYARLNKIALYGPAARPGRDLDYRFVQALPDGRFDFRTGCGHSLLACVVAEGRPGPVTVRAVTTGDTVLCTPEPGPVPPHAASGPPPAPPYAPGPPPVPPRTPGTAPSPPYTLHFLRPPGAPGGLPSGRPVDVLDGTPVSLVSYGNPYVFVDVRHLAAHRGDDALRDRLLVLRAEAARLLGHPPRSALPKIAAFGAGPGGLSVRALTVGGWHPRLALTGAAALAAAGALDGTVVPPVHGPVHTPGGPVTVTAGPDRVGVHHKRADVLDSLELPWRVHATA
ncbi:MULTISPECIES: hypothetical protein [unclassified Streptomyces]|uniref:hypothetical protein n=1 Tax=unclassified Streptomyces TaxID=2593676 RepID=UPI003808EDB7